LSHVFPVLRVFCFDIQQTPTLRNTLLEFCRDSGQEGAPGGAVG